MKIVMILDQIQSGLGTKDDKMLPLGGKKEPIGPAVMMEPFLKEINAKVISCLYCGNGTYLENPKEVSRKLCAMISKIKPDVVICGPAFNYIDYAKMCAHVAYDINTTTNIKAFAAMSEENEDTINAYKNKVCIVKTPKKGGLGLNDSLRNICKFAESIVNCNDNGSLENKICYK